MLRAKKPKENRINKISMGLKKSNKILVEINVVPQTRTQKIAERWARTDEFKKSTSLFNGER